jgi:rhodanese-related sulfurtransferase
MQAKQHLIVMVGVILLAAFISGCTTTAPAPEPAAEPDWQFHDIVDAAFVQQYAKVPMAENVMIIDARPKRAKYDKGHIPMAVSIPDSQFAKMTDTLPADKSALLIFYCGGLKCKLSHKSARKAEALGYKNVKVFAKGFPAWMKVKGNYACVSADYMKKQIDSKADMVVVDARPKRKKYDKGHIDTAISIPDTQFDKFKDRLPQDKSKLLVFYCGGFKCKLSHKSAAKAIAMGYTNVKVFSAGYPAWKKVVGGAAPVQVKAGAEEGSIEIATFKKIMAEDPTRIMLIDVRDADEFQTGSLKTAINIPVDELETKIDTLPVDKPIVFICGTGARSGESFYMVQDLRPEMKNVFYLDAELTVHKDGSFEIQKPQV